MLGGEGGGQRGLSHEMSKVTMLGEVGRGGGGAGAKLPGAGLGHGPLGASEQLAASGVSCPCHPSPTIWHPFSNRASKEVKFER